MLTKGNLMNKLRIYLDNCCFNRPYDMQDDITIQIETEAKIEVQKRIKNGELELCWSYILDFENGLNPYDERKLEIMKWKSIAKYDTMETEDILQEMT